MALMQNSDFSHLNPTINLTKLIRAKVLLPHGKIYTGGFFPQKRTFLIQIFTLSHATRHGTIKTQKSRDAATLRLLRPGSAYVPLRLLSYFGHSIITARKDCLQSWRHLRQSSLYCRRPLSPINKLHSIFAFLLNLGMAFTRPHPRRGQ